MVRDDCRPSRKASVAPVCDPVAFIALAEPRHQYAAASFVAALQRREVNPDSAELRLSAAWGYDLTAGERATAAAALWRDPDLFPPPPAALAGREAAP